MEDSKVSTAMMVSDEGETWLPAMREVDNDDFFGGVYKMAPVLK